MLQTVAYVFVLLLAISFLAKRHVPLMPKKIILGGFLLAMLAAFPWQSLLAAWALYASNRFTRGYLISLAYDYFGHDEASKLTAIDRSNQTWSRAWGRFREGFMRSASDGSGGSSRPRERLHDNVGFCQGWNVSASSKSVHPLYRCGNCGHAGCTDFNCPNSGFQGTKCKMCGAMMNFRR